MDLIKESLSNKYIIALLFGYLLTGFIADYLMQKFAKWVWKKSRGSYKKARIKTPQFVQDYYRDPFSWAPRFIGIIERFIYTSAVISGQYGLIGMWFLFKVIGEWGDKSKDASRVRANNFLLGTSVSLIFGILGGLIFQSILYKDYILKIIQNTR